MNPAQVDYGPDDGQVYIKKYISTDRLLFLFFFFYYALGIVLLTDTTLVCNVLCGHFQS